MRNGLRRFWALAFTAAGIAYLVHYLLGTGGAGLERLAAGHPGALAVALSIQLVHLIIANRIWTGVVAGLTPVRIGWLEAFAHMAMVNLGRYLPGRLWGTVARLAALSERGVGTTLGVTATVVEQLALAQGNFVLGLLVFPVATQIPAGLAAGAWAAALGSVVFAPMLLTYARALAEHWPRLARQLWPADLEVGTTYRRAVLGFLAAWLCNGAVLYALQCALFDGGADAMGLVRAIFANACGALAGTLAVFAPGGIGVRESAAAAVLATHLAFADALFLMVVLRLWMVLVDALLCLALLARSVRG